MKWRQLKVSDGHCTKEEIHCLVSNAVFLTVGTGDHLYQSCLGILLQVYTLWPSSDSLEVGSKNLHFI